MILIEKPYVSNFLRETIIKNKMPVILTDAAKAFDFTPSENVLDEKNAIEKITSSQNGKIYTNSENSIGWIAQNLSSTDLPEKIDLFKNKAKLRNLIKPLYPDFFFKEVPLGELKKLSVTDFPFPFIIKPTTGFFSMGVYKVSSPSEWVAVKKSLFEEIRNGEKIYPTEVLNTTSFIIEQCIKGGEFAIDVYFDEKGKPVILGIYQHIFASENDMSDRLYLTSKKIIESKLQEFQQFLENIGDLAKVKNFPMHVEIRQDASGIIIPIEINPLRFGGWCTTADATAFAFGFNPYVYYFAGKKPDWPQLLKTKESKLYSMMVLENSTGTEGKDINSFDYDLLLSKFKKPLELREINYKEYPVFAFLFSETAEDNFSELEYILKSNLTEFIQ